MNERFEDKSPQEIDNYEQAVGMIDPGGHLIPQINYFFQRLEGVRAMGEDEVPEDSSDAWVFKDSRYVDAFRAYSERFNEAAEAVAKLLAAEQVTHYTRASIEREIRGMLIARNQISSQETLTTADFPLDSGNSLGTE